jgi:hypothetical protein
LTAANPLARHSQDCSGARLAPLTFQWVILETVKDQ